MILTPSQIQQILAALNGKIDNETLATVKKLLETAGGNTSLPPGDTYDQIKTYSERLLAQYQALGRGITTDAPEDETLVVYMDVARVKRLLTIVPANGYVAAFPGIHTAGTGQNQLTISLLAADNNLRILPNHTTGNVCGEESWDNRNILGNMAAVLPIH